MSTLPSNLRSLSLLSLWKFGGNAPSLLESNQRHFRVEMSTIESGTIVILFRLARKTSRRFNRLMPTGKSISALAMIENFTKSGMYVTQSGKTLKLLEFRQTVSHINVPKLEGSTDSSLHSRLRCFNRESFPISLGSSTSLLFAISNRVKFPRSPIFGGRCVKLLRRRFRCCSFLNLWIPVTSLISFDASDRWIRSGQLSRIPSVVDRYMPSNTSVNNTLP